MKIDLFILSTAQIISICPPSLSIFFLIFQIGRRSCNKFDIILFDDASKMDEALSTMIFLFSPSSVILFGEPYKKADDHLNFNQKYPKSNSNQSMFERLRKTGRCVLHMESQFRFGEKISHFVSKFFCNGMAVNCRKLSPKPLDAFNVFHRKTDGYCFDFIKNTMQIIKPSAYNYGIIYPPNIERNSLIEKLCLG